MQICHDHNLRQPSSGRPRLYGIRVSLPDEDTLAAVLGPQWHAFHWFETAAERDRQLQEMATQHAYSRSGDRPTVLLERVSRSEVS